MVLIDVIFQDKVNYYLTQHIQHGSTTGIIFSTLLSISVIIIMINQVSLSNNDILSNITNFVTENKTILLSLMSGVIVGFSLGFIGGGGSILAVPLLLYVVGIEDPHVAIGTSALAVSINAAINLLHHARKRNVKFGEGLAFAIPGVVGTIIGSQLGLLTSPSSLILLFALLMLVMAAKMLVNKPIRKDILGNHGHSRRSVDFSNLTVPKQINFLMPHRLKLMGLLVGLASRFLWYWWRIFDCSLPTALGSKY